jgi:translation initiation factor eIF-2B subunit delta
VDDAWARVERAAADPDSGAAQIARRAAAALAALSPDRVRNAVDLLLRGHPSMAPLWRLANEVLPAADHAAAARTFLGRLDLDRQAAESAAAMLPDRVLTISYSSTVVEAIRIRRPQQTVCMRSEPGGEGWRMAEETRDVTTPILMDDDEALDRVPGDAVIVGADAVTPQGLVNKVKTAALAGAAGAKGIPRYAVTGETKFIESDLPVGERFEVAGLGLFTAIAVPEGLLSPEQAEERAKAVRLVPELQDLLRELSGGT